jgi:hypothetical protein
VKHSQARACLADYLEGDLDLDRRAIVDAHLAGCEECSRELGELRSTVALLRGLPDPVPPADLVDNIMSRVRSGEARPSLISRIGAWAEDFLWPGLAVPAAAAAAALFVAAVSGQIQLPGLVGSEPASSPSLRIPLRAVRTPAAAFSAVPTERPPAPGTTAQAQLVSISPQRAPLPTRLGRQTYAQSVRSSGAREEDFPRTADDWLVVLTRSPVGFAKAQAAMTTAKQELWVRQLARRAVERGIERDVIRSLRRTRAPEALALAEAFRDQIREERP